MKKHHFVYKITNLINQKYYVGVHSTNSLEDGYMGSGTAIKNAIQKYGIENFKREILVFVQTPEEKWLAEIKHVTLQVVKDKNSYNMAPGGRNWIAAMKREQDPNFKKHQSKAGKFGAAAYLGSLSEQEKRNWHSAGGKKSTEIRMINKTGFFSPEVIEKRKRGVSAAIKNTVELWHPDAPETVTNRKSPGYISGWSVRAKPDSEKFKEYIKLGFFVRSPQILKGK